MTYTSNPKLAPIFEFFEQTGAKRLQGLDPSYFEGLNESEKEEAWNFLRDRFASSTDTINGLYYLDQKKAIEAFKREVEMPIAASPYPSQRKYREECRLLMLHYIIAIESDEKYVSAMNEFAGSEFEEVRSLFAKSVPIHGVTQSSVEALKGMIFTEVEVIPLAAAITKLMVIHGMDFDRKDPLYKSIYMALRSDNPEEKTAAIRRLEYMQPLDYKKSV